MNAVKSQTPLPAETLTEIHSLQQWDIFLIQYSFLCFLVPVLINAGKNSNKSLGFGIPDHSPFTNKVCKLKIPSMRLLSMAFQWWLNSLWSPNDPKIWVFLPHILYKYKLLIKIGTLLVYVIELSQISKKWLPPILKIQILL